MMIKNSLDIIEICTKENVPIWEVAISYEEAQSGFSREEIVEKMGRHFSQMQKSIDTGLDLDDRKIRSKMFRDDAKKLMVYRKKNKPLSGTTISKAVAYALSVMELNCSMGRIVASPTAGSCGVLPAVIISAMETLKMKKKHGVNALFTAGMVGTIIAKNASLSGAIGGCQAEIGSASAMAAAAVVEMAGGSPQMAFDAAAIALKSVMGLICDPVAGLVEVPCAKRNGMGASNALIAADMVLAGIPSVIPFDEVVWAMNKVSQIMPSAHKETSEGGIAITPTGQRLRDEIFGED
ncbi:MAG: L-serine ammonia-lyase, iron-sulfur-dependent, subunit alpha [Clostridiales bacterium]|nr:L-serine ammonia-lyase, iron-sulfur-dependent, subunit alpha [Clostridiales bacterium]